MNNSLVLAESKE
jgi:hypothetical protein